MKACNVYAVDALERFSKTKRIEASLLEQGLQPMGLQVEMPEKGFVRISGIVENQVSKDSIAQLVKLTPGVERVDSRDTPMGASRNLRLEPRQKVIDH
ncbi:MAG: BON domain-containing protein [Desulfobacterales bacterium]|nr:BON domain-containing protein [Desulfobacterales bacterium]